MAKSTLTDTDIENTQRFVASLVEDGFPIGFAGWLRDSEDDDPWRLYIATPLWDVDGPINTVSLLDRYMTKRGADFDLTMHDVEIGPSEAEQMKAIRRALIFEDGSIALKQNILHGVSVDSPGVFVSLPETAREKVKAARRHFEKQLEELEAA